MSGRGNVSTGSPYELIIGLSRAARMPRFIDRHRLVETEMYAVI